MGGSGNYQASGGGNQKSEDLFDCAKVYFKTNIPSPDVVILSKIIKGDILTLNLAGKRGPIQLLNSNSEFVGNLSSKHIPDLINCMNNGYKYIAEVTEIFGGKCSILVTSL